MIFITPEQKGKVSKYLNELLVMYEEGEIIIDSDDMEALELFLKNDVNGRVDYNWLEIVLEYLNELLSSDVYRNNSEYLGFYQELLTRKELVDSAIKEAKNLHVSSLIQSKAVTPFSKYSNSAFYYEARKQMEENPTANTDSIQQEIYNRGYANFNEFGDNSGSTKYGKFSNLSDYLNDIKG